MPITLGSPTESPPWNRYILMVLWLCQFFTTGFLEFWLFIIVAFIGDSTRSIVIFVFVPTLLGNLAMLISVLYEAHQFAIEALTVRKYYRFQLVKSGYIAFLLLAILIAGIGLPKATLGGIAQFWGVLWRTSLFVAPYWGALWYALVVKRKFGDSFEDEGLRRFW